MFWPHLKLDTKYETLSCDRAWLPWTSTIKKLFKHEFSLKTSFYINYIPNSTRLNSVSWLLCQTRGDSLLILYILKRCNKTGQHIVFGRQS